jgi:small subunit ribosomal protein S4
VNSSRPKAKRSRALGIALTPKCVRYLEARPYPPGQHGRARKKGSDYKTRLLEKQRLRAQYDINETQMRRAYEQAHRGPHKTGEALLRDLETRLDAFVLRAGLARTIYQARQLVSHRHITVNGRLVTMRGYRLKVGDVVSVAERSRSKEPFLVAAAGAHAEAVPAYISSVPSSLTARLERLPERREIPVICDEQLVVEFYSR